MKSIKSMMMGGAILISLSMMFTSCEGALDDILGEWSRPTPGNNTPSGGGSSTINATAIKLDQKMKVLVKDGATLTITATVTPSDATYTWESSDQTIATVDNGVVTPVGLGIAKITAKSGDLSATCEVFVGTVVDDVSTRNPIQNYDILAGTQNSSSITIPDGYHVAFNGVNTNKGIICSGNATIYLTDGSTNTVQPPSTTGGDVGIKVGGAGTTLTINAETEGTGTLNVTGSLNGAAIGTAEARYSDQQCGDITINGGKITANVGYAAGIGTGYADSGHTNQCGNITINGGEIDAIGSNYGTGIGTGYSAASQICGNITIGTGITSVKATRGGSYCSPIGKGAGYGSQSCGTIKFGKAQVFDGSTWDASINFSVDGNYGPFGGLNLAISTITWTHDTWTLTPAP